MKDVSALMDGELERTRIRSTISKLEGQDELRDAWATFHLIRDALQGNVVGSSRFIEKFHERLEQEPVSAIPRWRARLPRLRTTVLAGLLAVLLGTVALAWIGTGGPVAPVGKGVQPNVPFVDGGLNDPVAVEFAMAHRQLVPAFMAMPDAAKASITTPAADGVPVAGPAR